MSFNFNQFGALFLRGKSPALPIPADLAGMELDGREASVGSVSLELAADRLQKTLQRSLGIERGSGQAVWHFSILCLLSQVNFTLKSITAAFPIQHEPIDTEGVVDLMANLGFHAMRVQGGKDGPPRKNLPMLFVPNKGQPGVLFEDPNSGELRLARGPGDVVGFSQLGRHRLGWGWAFRQESANHSMSEARRGHTGHSWFRALLSNFEKSARALLLVSMGIALMTLLLPVFTIQMYAQVIGLGSAEPLPYFIAGMSLVVVIEIALIVNRTRMISWLSSRLDYLASVASFAQLLKVKPAISERAAVTDQAARLRSFDSVRDFITGPMFSALLDLPLTVTVLCVVAWLGGWLVVVPILGIGAHLGLYFALRQKARIATSVAADETTELQRLAIETFEKRDAIREAGLHHLWSRRLVRNARREQRAQFLLRMIGALGEAGSGFIFSATLMALLAGGAMLSWQGRLDSAALLAITIVGFRGLAPFHVLCLSVQRIEQLRNSIRQLNSLSEIAQENSKKGNGVGLSKLKGGVSLVNAGFRAGDTRPVFVGLDLEIEPGDVVGITGANGAGKTTLLSAIQGTQELSLGAVRIDGVDLRQLPVAELRSRISYVPQYPKLFSGTLRENLMFADPLADAQRVEKVLKIVGLSEELSELGGGLDYVIGNEGAPDLSTQFRYKFAFAQALLVDSQLILIDELPNSLLSGRLGQVLENLIRTVRGKRTVIFISYRTDFLGLADRVIALRYGKIPMVSTPSDLMERAA